MRDENIPAFIGHLSFSFLAHGHRVPSLNWIITHLSHSIINWDDLDIFFLHTTNMRDCFSVCSSPHSSFNFHRLWAGGADIEAEYVFLLFWTFTQQLMISLFFSPLRWVWLSWNCRSADHPCASAAKPSAFLSDVATAEGKHGCLHSNNSLTSLERDSAQPLLNGFPAPLSTLSSR